MKRKFFFLIVIFTVFIVLVAAAAVIAMPHKPEVKAVYIVYGSEKGDLSYTDAAYKGLSKAREDFNISIREFTPVDFETLPGILEKTAETDRPGLIITVGFQYAGFTQQLAENYPDIKFLAIDQSGIESGNVLSYEIISYGDSYLSGVLAASATKTGRVGIIMGMQSDVLDIFLQGYKDGVLSVNSSMNVSHAYVHQYLTKGFSDPRQAGIIAEKMYQNGTDVIFMCAGYSNMGAFEMAKNSTGLYIIGTDSDQSPLGPEFVLASAVKRVDTVVYTGISEQLNGSFAGGVHAAGLKDGVTGLLFNPKFEIYNKTVMTWQSGAQNEEEKYLASCITLMKN